MGNTFADSAVPVDINAEQALLACWLDDDAKSSCYLKTANAVGDYYVGWDLYVAEAIKAVVDAGMRASPAMVASELDQRNELAQVGGRSFLQELIALPHNADEAASYAGILRECAQRRRMMAAAKDACEKSADRNIAVSCARDAMTRFLMDSTETHSQSMSDMCREEMTRIADRDRLEQERKSWPRTRIASVDAILDGLCPGRLGILAGPPGSGKSSLAGWIVEKNAACDQKIPCAYISLEMPYRDVVRRLACGESRTENCRVDRRDLTEQELTRYNEALEAMSNLPICIVDSSTCRATEGDVMDAIRQEAVVDHCRLIVVDYVQLVKPNRSNTTRADELSRFAAQLKVLAIHENVYVLALSQVNREAVKEGGLLQMQDLKDSSGLEQAADDILMLQEMTGSTDETGIIACSVSKHRSGKRGRCQLEFSKQYQQWSSRDKRFVEEKP